MSPWTTWQRVRARSCSPVSLAATSQAQEPAHRKPMSELLTTLKWVCGDSGRAHIGCSLWAQLPLCNSLRVSADPEPSPSFRPINVSWQPETSKAPSEAGMRCRGRLQLIIVIYLIMLCAIEVQGEASTPIWSDQHRESIPIACTLRPE